MVAALGRRGPGRQGPEMAGQRVASGRWRGGAVMAAAARVDDEHRFGGVKATDARQFRFVAQRRRHAGAMDSRLIVILDDNDMSIAPPVGALSSYLSKLLSSKVDRTLREGSKRVAK